MASLDLIREFQNKNKVEINGENIKLNFERFLTLYQDQKTREEKMKTFAMGLYQEIANKFEREKVNSVHYHSSEPITTTSLEFFEGYMNIMSELAKEASDHLVELSKEDAEKAKNAVKKEQELFDDVKKRHDTAVENFNINHPNKDRDINENSAYVDLKKEYDVAKMRLDNMKERERSLVDPVPLESTKNYFGMTVKEAKSLLEKQVNSYNYMDERRTQMETVGVRFDGFMNELNNAFKDENVTYQNATAEQKRGMQEVYATKKLMNEQLKSKIGSGIFSWFWKIWYRKDISAINGYIDAANKALNKANFSETDAKEADDAMTKQGYFYGEYQAADTVKNIEEKLAKNEESRANEEEKLAKNEESRANKEEKLAKNEESRANEKGEYQNDIKNQLFEINFKPANTLAELNKQLKVFEEVNTYVKGNNNIPQNVSDVFKANGKKLSTLSYNYQLKGNGIFSKIDSICEKIEKSLMTKISADDYKPMTFEEVKASATVKEQMTVNLEDTTANLDVSKPVDTAPSKEIDPFVKNS